MINPGDKLWLSSIMFDESGKAVYEIRPTEMIVLQEKNKEGENFIGELESGEIADAIDINFSDEELEELEYFHTKEEAVMHFNGIIQNEVDRLTQTYQEKVKKIEKYKIENNETRGY